MDLLNVEGWRHEPDAAQSELSARLLAWLTRSQTGAMLATDDAAAEVEAGLRDLIEAQAGLLLMRTVDGCHLRLLAAGGNYDLDARHGASPLWPATALFELLPPTPVFVASAGADLQLPIAELSAWVAAHPMLREARAAGEERRLPSLVIPLSQLGGQGEFEINAVALFWVATTDGMLPGFLQPAVEAVAGNAGAWLGATRRAGRLGHSYRQLAEIFGDAIDGKEPHKAGHAGAVSYYGGLIAREMNLGEAKAESVEFAALLHGIGKISVPDAILQKGEGLSESEFQAIRNAAVVGGEWLSRVEGLDEVATIVRHQGERFDGSGYPDGLKGSDIPIGSRVLAVALRFSAMTRPRADRRPMSVVGGALESVATDTQGALDPEVVQAFLAVMGRRL